MTYEQYLLVQLAEEAAEIGEMASKCIRFGLDEKRADLDQNNRERLIDEINDLIGVVEALNFPGGYLYYSKVDAKQYKIKKYADYSRKLGIIDKG